MSEITKILEIEDTSESLLLDMELELKNGALIVKARSETLEAFFKKLSGGETSKLNKPLESWGAIYIPWTRPFRIPGLYFQGNQDPIILAGAGEQAQALWIAKVGLKDGIEIKFPETGSLVTIQTVAMYENLIEAGMVAFYSQYLKPYNSSLELTLKKKRR